MCEGVQCEGVQCEGVVYAYECVCDKCSHL